MRRPALLAIACACSCAPLAARSPAPAPLSPAATSPHVSVEGAVGLPAPLAPVPCGSDAWVTYAHDAARTSASGACLPPPLVRSWRFAPPSAPGREATASHAIASGDVVYPAGTLGDSPALWRVDARTGERRWTFDSRADIPHRMWPTLADSTVALVDDGLFFVDPDTGKNRGHALDAWGESLPDGARVVVMNTWQADGDPPYVGAFDANARALWVRDRMGHARGYRPPDVGGIAMADGLVVHARNQAQRGAHVSGFDASSGERRWTVTTTTPESSPSIAGGRVFLIERWLAAKTDRLVARSLATGDVVWSRELVHARGPAPMLTGSLVVVHGDEGVRAFAQGTGEPRWTAAIPRTTPAAQGATTLAAATGSGLLVACAAGRVHVLRLADGAPAWTSEPLGKSADSPTIAGDALYVAVDGAVVRLASGR